MDRKRILPAAALLLALLAPSSLAGRPGENPNPNQVRVTAERASIYIEPSRGSTRIDIVGKGALLNLLQTKKVNDIWYHVSFSSSRYGTRISGFILDSAVELVGETIPPPREEKKAPEKAAVEPPAPRKAEEKELTEPVSQPSPEFEVSLVPTALPEGKLIVLPGKAAPLQNPAWRPADITPTDKVPVKPKIKLPERPETSEILVFTPILRGRRYAFPRKATPLQEMAWRTEEVAPAKAPPQPEKKIETEQPKAPPPTPTPREKEVAAAKPKAKPVKPQTIRPPRSPVSRKGPGRMSLGLGYGSSFGGAGACFQVNTGRGIALHAGVGIFPTTVIYSETDWVKNKPLWSIGLKYYLPLKSSLFSPYVDIQYGGLRVEAAQVVIGIWDYEYVYSREQKTLYGPSLLGGIEIRKGWFGIGSALGISYATTSWEMLQNKVSLSFDVSLMVHF
jgi:hypothetical protein